MLGTYHNGRAWATASKVTQRYLYQDATVNTSIAPEIKEFIPPPSMLYFSEVFYTDETQTIPVSFPRWIPENNLQIPFKVSNAITGVIGVGRYLYILGDNEAFILSGSSVLDFTLESLGDSIGCLSANSLQRVSGKAIWLGAGSVFVAQGGQVIDVGVEVRDLILSLNLLTLSSGVDFVRDTYFLTDGALTLCFHLREGGWTTRTLDAANQRIVHGGGVVYMLGATTLYSWDGTLNPDATYPLYKTARVAWQGLDAGDLWNKKGFHGMAVALDCDGSSTITDLSSVEGVPAQNSPQIKAAGVQAPLWRWKGFKATQVSIELSLLPAQNTMRCILRPPLTVAVADLREATV